MELVTLSDCVKYFKGYAFKSQWYSADGHPIIKVSDFTSDSIDVSNQSRIKSEFALQFQKYAIHTGDVIIQTVGSWPDNPDSVVGKVVRANQLVNGALLNQNAVNIIPLNNINKTYLYYLLKSELFKGYIINTAQGAANQASITLESILGYKFLLPPLPTQRRIASILSAYDELIEVNNQRIKLLEETARQLYKEWFVRMRFPEYKKAKFVKGVPEGWEVKSLYDIAEVTYGFPFQSELFNDKGEGIPVIRIRDLIEGSISTFTTEIADEKYYAEDGDILVGMDGDFHYCKWAAGRVWINQRNVRFRPLPKSNISRYFLYHVTKPHIEFLNEIIVGTTVAHLSATDLKKMKLLIPNEELLSAFKQISEPIYEQEIVLKQQNTQLRQIRDRLLPRLVSGKLAVKPLAAYPENERLTMAAEG
jgi:type I restriction enzyme, S subunit